MKMRFLFFIALGCLFPLSTYAENQPSAKSTSVLQDFDQALEQVAERAMRSVVEIEVTGYGSPEHDESSSQVLQLQRTLGSGVIVDPDGSR